MVNVKLTNQGKKVIVYEAENMRKGDVLLLQQIDNKNIHVVQISYGGIGNSWASFKGCLKPKEVKNNVKR